MNSTQIEYFLTLCKYKNYSETARRLFVSQPTISKQIAALEEELDMKLFERSTNTLKLTMQGAIMKKAFSEALQTIEDAQSEALNYTKHISDKIRIGLLEGSDIGFFLLAPLTELIKHFETTLDIQISFLSHKDLNEHLHKNLLDIGITLLPEVAAHPELEYTKLRTVSMGLISHRSLGVIKNDMLDLTQIQKQTFFFNREGSLHIKEFLKKQESILGLNPNQYQNLPNIDSLLTNVELAQGIAIAINTPRIMSNKDLVFFPLESQPITIVAAWNRTNDNASRNRMIKRMRRIIIGNGQF